MENLVNDVKCLVKELGVEKFTLVINSGARMNSVLKSTKQVVVNFETQCIQKVWWSGCP